jgi:pyruvate dehydrogenase (quinone)/pyruvate oxidase
LLQRNRFAVTARPDHPARRLLGMFARRFRGQGLWDVRRKRGRLAVGRIASEALIERLADWGVDTVFGLPGDGINGIMEGLRRHQDRVRFVLVHHEEAAAFMATAHAKATGRIGVCLATSGPGGIHLLNGLYDAKLDHMPVLAITGMQETSVLGTGYQQEVNLDKLYADVAEYDQMSGENPWPAG